MTQYEESHLVSDQGKLTWGAAQTSFEPAKKQIEIVRDRSKQPLPVAWDRAQLVEAFKSLFDATHGLVADAALNLRQGNTFSVVADIEALLRICKIAGQQPSIDYLRYKHNWLKFAEYCTWQLLQSGDFTSDDLLRLQEAWNATNVLPETLFFLRTDRVLAPISNEYISDLLGITGGRPVSLETEVAFYIWKSSLKYIDEKRFIKNVQTLIDSLNAAELDENWGGVVAISNTIRDKCLSDKFMILDGTFGATAAVTVRESIRAQARIHLTRCVIALERFRFDHDSYPENLHQLVPTYVQKIPLDPYDGLPLRYRLVSTSEFALYSIAENLTDDGGDAAPPPGKHISKPKDDVWEKPILHSQSR